MDFLSLLILQEKSRRKGTPLSRKVIENITKEKKFKYQLDKVGYVIIIFTFVYLTFVITQYSQSEEAVFVDLSNKALIAIILAITGFISLFIINDSKKKTSEFEIEISSYDRQEFSITFITFGIGVGIIAVMNNLLLSQFVSKTYNITGYDLLLFSVAMAIVEEVAFTFLFQITFEFLFNSQVAGVIVRGIAFYAYHLAVYGENPEFLLSVFLTGIILAITLKVSKRITTNILIHAFLNILASGFVFQIA